jgi:serine/threonine-protein phosphatase 2A regulatory subunit A
MIICTLNL